MLIHYYIKALLVDAKCADAVWEAWNVGALCDYFAAWAWLMTVSTAHIGKGL